MPVVCVGRSTRPEVRGSLKGCGAVPNDGDSNTSSSVVPRHPNAERSA